MSQNPKKNRMADELFKLVEGKSGYAHISDGIDVLSEDQILELAAQCRDRHAECLELLNAFVLHHATRIVLKRPYKKMSDRKTRVALAAAIARAAVI